MVKSYISAIKAVLKTNGIELNENQYLILSLTKACRLKNDNVKTRLPIYKGLLQLLIKKIKQIFEEKGQPYLSILYQALFSTAYFGLFRVGELTKGEHPVLARDIHIGANKKKILFILRTSKTHWKNNRPQMVKIASDQSKSAQNNALTFLHSRKVEQNTYCPYRFLRDFLRV